MRAIERLGKHHHLVPSFNEEGALFAASPYQAVSRIAEGVYHVHRKVHRICDPTIPGQLRLLINTRLTRLERYNKKRHEENVARMYRMRAELVEKRKQEDYEFLMED